MVVRDPSPALREAVGTTIAATVTGVDRQGHLLLRTDRGVLALATQLRPPVGSEVLVQLRLGSGAQLQAYILQVREPGASHASHPAGGALPAAASDAAAARGHLPIPPPGLLTDAAALTRIWPALDEVMRLLAQGGGAAPIPAPGPTFVAGLSAFLGALLSGEARQWLGAEAVRLLQHAGHGAALQGLERDFALLQGLARDAGNDFRLFVLPFQHDDAARPLRLFVRQDHEDAWDSSAQSRRFIVEVELPRLGDIQIDGLAGNGRLNMILRSREALDAPLRDELLAIFGIARSRSGFTGEFHFAFGREWRFQPIEAGSAGNGSVVV